MPAPDLEPRPGAVRGWPQGPHQALHPSAPFSAPIWGTERGTERGHWAWRAQVRNRVGRKLSIESPLGEVEDLTSDEACHAMLFFRGDAPFSPAPGEPETVFTVRLIANEAAAHEEGRTGTEACPDVSIRILKATSLFPTGGGKDKKDPAPSTGLPRAFPWPSTDLSLTFHWPSIDLPLALPWPFHGHSLDLPLTFP